jgi:hypothetical protein
MKSRLLRTAVWCVGCAWATSVWAYDVIGTNVVQNSSFEQVAERGPLPAAWSGTTKVYARETNTGRDGTACLRFSSTDARQYVLCTQKVPVGPGWKCQFSGWVKTRDVEGPESGATLCMEWSGPDGKWLGGSYPGGIRGTRDWTRIEGVACIPPQAQNVRLSCYLRHGMTGTAWFDDVTLVRVADPPLSTLLLSPVYRGRIDGTGPASIRARIRWNLKERGLKPAEVSLRAHLIAAQGPALHTLERRPQDEAPLDLEIPCVTLEPGHYRLTICLLDRAGKTLQQDVLPIERVASDFRPACVIDAHRRLLVHGRPFFPIGMYWSTIKEDDLRMFGESKFNCIMPYGSPTRAQMDLAEKYGQRVIYSIKDWYAGSTYCPRAIRTKADEEPLVRQRVREMRDHPALLAWYLNDELSQTFIPQLEAHQRWVAEEDAGHPTWAVLYQYREVAAYRNTFDVIGTDPYPIGRKPASEAAVWTAETLRQVDGVRPLWQVPQLHNWANYEKNPAHPEKLHTPSFDEVRSMAWQCIAEGATGLVFYSWGDVKRNPDVPFDVQWAGLKRIAAEIDSLAAVLLSVEPAPRITAHDDTAAQPAWLHSLVRRHQGKLYLFAVNDGDGQGRITWTLSTPVKSVRVHGKPQAIGSSGSTFADALKPLAVTVYEIEMR